MRLIIIRRKIQNSIINIFGHGDRAKRRRGSAFSLRWQCTSDQSAHNACPGTGARLTSGVVNFATETFVQKMKFVEKVANMDSSRCAKQVYNRKNSSWKSSLRTQYTRLGAGKLHNLFLNDTFSACLLLSTRNDRAPIQKAIR